MKIHFALFFPFLLNAQMQWEKRFETPARPSQLGFLNDTALFKVDTAISALQLDAPPVSASASLALPSEIRLKACWNLEMGYAFNPSSSNYAKVFLWADAQTPSQISNGLFISVGGNTGDNLIMSEIENGQVRELLRSPDKLLDSDLLKLKIKVCIDSMMMCKLWVDTSKLGGQPVLIGSTTVGSNAQSSSHFVLQCIYTSTRSNKFFFYNLSAQGEPFIDHSKPELLDYEQPFSKQFIFRFSHEPEYGEALDPDYFRLLPGYISPVRIEFGSHTKEVFVEFPVNMADTVVYDLLIDQYPFGSKGVLDTILRNVWLYELRLGDLRISELLVDPEPVVLMPEYEGLEIFNASRYMLDLKDLKIINATGNHFRLDSGRLASHDYVWVYDQKAGIDAFPHINSMPVSWPFGFLANSYGELSLANSKDMVLDRIVYTDDYYGSDIKAEGGWTLERINLEHSCTGPENWRASISTIGGTPGQVNSVPVNQYNPEVSSYLGWGLEGNRILHVYFEGSPNLGSANIEIYPNTQGIDSLFALDATRNHWCMFLKNPLNSEDTIVLKFIDLMSCSEEIHESVYEKVSLPEPLDSGNLRIDEVMFQPHSDCPEFVEVWNTGQKPIDLKGLRLVVADSPNQQPYASSDLWHKYFSLKPNNRMVIGSSRANLMSCYSGCQALNSSELKRFPALKDDGACIGIANQSLQLLDFAVFDNDLHHSTLAETEGHSLQRLDVHMSGDESRNWRTSPNYESAGLPVLSEGQNLEKQLFWVESSCFSPNGDGLNDYLELKLKLGSKPAWIELLVLNVNGQEVGSILERTWHLGDFILNWDGQLSNQAMLNVGMYQVLARLHWDTGKIDVYRKIFAVCKQ